MLWSEGGVEPEGGGNKEEGDCQLASSHHGRRTGTSAATIAVDAGLD